MHTAHIHRRAACACRRSTCWDAKLRAHVRTAAVTESTSTTAGEGTMQFSAFMGSGSKCQAQHITSGAYQSPA